MIWRGLLVSVRNAAEATEALAGGASIIDVKEPLAGPLGAPVVVINNNPRYTFTGVATTTGDVRP